MVNGMDVRVYIPDGLLNYCMQYIRDAGLDCTIYPCASGMWRNTDGDVVYDDIRIVSILVADVARCRSAVTKIASYLKFAGQSTVLVQYIPTSFDLL